MNKKKILASVLSLIFIISAITGITTVFADSNDNNWVYDETSKTLTIKTDTDNYTEENYTSSPWYSYKSEIKNIVIENGVTSIGDFSFSFANNVENVTLAQTLTNIGTGAFVGNDALKQLTIPDSVVSIGDYAFGYNSDMQLTEGFAAKCSPNSFAQKYCFKNYIMFDSPIALGENGAVINSANEQFIYSFAPKTNCSIVFNSISNDDTFGLIYDAQDYIYSDKFSELSKSAIVNNDDGDGTDDENLNFSITYNLTAGKRYYLCAKYKNPTKTGEFKVNFAFTCNEHIYNETVTVKPDCETDGKSTFTCIGCGASYENKLYALGHNYSLNSFDGTDATVKCTRCDSEYTINFTERYNQPDNYLDVVNDGIVNAKDYAKLMKEYK